MHTLKSFFRYKTDFFYFDGKKYELYKREKAMELIPDDLKITFKRIENDKVCKTDVVVKNYLKSTDFYEKEYEPLVDFSKNQIFSKIENIQGINIDYHF